jgi:hypothetical protein
LRIGLLGIGFAVQYPAAGIRNFRALKPDEKSGTSWRGSHLAFDYGSETIEFGSYVDANRAVQLLAQYKNLFPAQNIDPIVMVGESRKVVTAAKVSKSSAVKLDVALGQHSISCDYGAVINLVVVQSCFVGR